MKYNPDYYADEDIEFFNTQALPQRPMITMPKHLWSEILPNLWQGGTADWDTCFEMKRNREASITADTFDTVITTYSFANPCDWLVKELRYGYYDADVKHIDFKTLGQLVNVAHADWKDGKKVLIRCQAGLNRSGLVMALVLMKEGYTARNAIDLIRKQRGISALCNDEFVAWLLKLDTPTPTDAE